MNIEVEEIMDEEEEIQFLEQTSEFHGVLQHVQDLIDLAITDLKDEEKESAYLLDLTYFKGPEDKCLDVRIYRVPKTDLSKEYFPQDLYEQSVNIFATQITNFALNPGDGIDGIFTIRKAIATIVERALDLNRKLIPEGRIYEYIPQTSHLYSTDYLRHILSPEFVRWFEESNDTVIAGCRRLGYIGVRKEVLCI